MVIQAFARAKAGVKKLKLILAPRDPDRCKSLINTLDLKGLKAACFSDPASDKKRADILFIDQMGELVPAYSVCSLAFVGGSLVPQGGHNLLEPAMFGKPVVFGPYMTDFEEAAQMLLDAGGGDQVSDKEGLEKLVARLVLESGLQEKMGRAAQTVFMDNAGAVNRIIRTMEVKGFV
jgi:3-deoxy-D-manno-octulosonic-acid transferase